jgi:hypothetical protein
VQLLAQFVIGRLMGFYGLDEGLYGLVKISLSVKALANIQAAEKPCLGIIPGFLKDRDSLIEHFELEKPLAEFISITHITGKLTASILEHLGLKFQLLFEVLLKFLYFSGFS